MRRTLIITLTALSLLLQGLGAAWAAPVLRAAAAVEQSEAQVESEMPCHGSKPAETQDTRVCPCCDDGAMCGKLCGSAGTALPVRSSELQDYLDAHFESLRRAPELFPAHSLTRFKPPIAPLS